MSAIKFEDFNFEIIDIDLPGRPYMLIGKRMVDMKLKEFIFPRTTPWFLSLMMQKN